MKGTTVLLEECLLVANHLCWNSWTMNQPFYTPGYSKLTCSWQENGSWTSIYFLENMYFLPCHFLVLPEGYRSCVFSHGFDVLDTQSGLGFQSYPHGPWDAATVWRWRSSEVWMGRRQVQWGSLDICEFWVENWKMASVKGYTDVCIYIYMTSECSLNVLYFQDSLTVYCLDDYSVMIYSTIFWFTILSIILTYCFYTMCNMGIIWGASMNVLYFFDHAVEVTCFAYSKLGQLPHEDCILAQLKPTHKKPISKQDKLCNYSPWALINTMDHGIVASPPF